jgi:hypothetical protein
MPFIKGHVVTQETREKIGRAHKGKIVSEEARKRMSKSLSGRKLSPEHVEAIRRARTGYRLSTETKARIGFANRRDISYSDGYKYVKRPGHPFGKGPTGKMLEHRVVMEEHIGRYLCPGEVVHHKNGDRGDNRIGNLRLFATNSSHMKAHGSGRRCLTMEQAREIRGKRAEGMVLRELAEEYGIDRSSIGKLCNNKTYPELVAVL